MPIRYDLCMTRFGVPPPPMARYIKGDDSDGSKAHQEPNPACLGWANNDEKLG